MANGHLGKCKACTKSDTKKRTYGLKSDAEWVANETAKGLRQQSRLSAGLWRE